MKQMIIVCLVLGWVLSSRAQTSANAPCPSTSTFDATTNSMTLVDCHAKVISQSSLQVAAPADTQLTADLITGQTPPVTKSQQDFLIWQNDYTKRIFEHQNTYTVFIFIVVNTLVLAGLYFAWLQFKATVHISERMQHTSSAGSIQPDKGAAPDLGQETIANSELKLGPDGLAISSSFIGLIILGFSMGFYFMYLQYVYPIHTVDAQRAAQTQAAAVK
jgi:hypothetical protein